MKIIRSIIAAVVMLCGVSLSQVDAQELPKFSTGGDEHFYYIQFVKGGTVVDDIGQELRNRVAVESRPAQLWKLTGDADGCILTSGEGRMIYFSSADKRFKSSTTESTQMKLVANNSGQWELQLCDEGLQPAAGSVAMVMNGGSGEDRYLDVWKHNFAACGLAFVAAADMDFDYQSSPANKNEVKLSGSGRAPEEALSLWYREPASNWVTQALPIGNGEMGAMIFGGIAQDRIQFNHKTLWKGSAGATDLGSYLPFGDIYVINRDARASSNYVRSLNMAEGVADVTYQSEGTGYGREYFASNPDGVIAVRYTAQEGRPLDLELQLINANGKRARYSAAGATFDGKLANGMEYAAEMAVSVTGGRVEATKQGIEVTGAESVTIYLSCGTTFDSQAPGHLSGTLSQLATKIGETVAKAEATGYDALRARHVADHKSLMGRVDFALSGAANDVPTDQLLDRTTQGSATAMTDMLVFQYGRYLTIASSRGIAVPSNLQGLWNKDGSATTNAVWASDIHSNINVQMNYWPAEPTNLSECHLPLLDFLYNEATRADGTWSKNARDLGVSKGWVVNTAGNIFGGSSNYKRGKYSVANAWLCDHLWQHYAYTRDTTYLRDRAMPLMKSACEFWFERLVESASGDGTLECPNEYSPEHGRVQNATAHSQQLVTMLMENTQKAIAVLGDESGCDATFRATLADKLSRLDRGMRVGSDGMLREWKYQENTPNQPADKNYYADDEANVWQGHRHTSHLMGLYPGFTIDEGIDPDIFKAAVASLDDRGDVATGWARAWRISLWARARNKARAYTTLRGFAHHTKALSYDWHGGLYDNMLDAHATSVFQIDGNFGATAGIAELLLQSRPDSMVVLPTLPAEWTGGHIKGLRAIGNFEVDIEWDGGELQQLRVQSLSGEPATLCYPGIESWDVVDEAGEQVVATRVGNGLLTIPTRKGGVYTVVPGNGSTGVDRPMADGSITTVYDLSGRVLPAGQSRKKGIYIVKSNKEVRKVVTTGNLD